MKFTKLLLMTTLTMTLLSLFIGANATSNFSPNQVKQIENIVHDYLISNPEVLVKVSKALQRKQLMKMQTDFTKKAAKNVDRLFRSKTSPVIGNNHGKVTLVEFFDYQCGHCKDMGEVIEDLTKHNPELRVVLKEFPIFGETSELASKAALAANEQGKYAEVHQALLAVKSRLDEETIMEAAGNNGLNIEQLTSDMKNKTVLVELDQTKSLAKKLNIQGTPMFFVAETNIKSGNPSAIGMIPGQAAEGELQSLIDKVTRSVIPDSERERA